MLEQLKRIIKGEYETPISEKRKFGTIVFAAIDVQVADVHNLLSSVSRIFTFILIPWQLYLIFEGYLVKLSHYSIDWSRGGKMVGSGRLVYGSKQVQWALQTRKHFFVCSQVFWKIASALIFLFGPFDLFEMKDNWNLL